MKNHLRNIVGIWILTLMVSACTESKKPESPTDNMTIDTKESEQARQLRHMVLFKFKASASAEEITAVEEAFAALPAKIPEIKGYEWGINNSPEGLNKGFTHGFLLTFDSEEGRAAYLPHPDHQAFGSLLQPVLEDVMVLDYWAL